ncbi:hypothetical protein LL912_00785 [Niabella sp. CC-SYL272]|uniref:helix-turn-helix domain-containing protein n=1 Tax=Niabella agricola TaxID=2891571 RepID=UPI001F16FE6E|nr:helix-turn-helix domain-containing protein [Niabella agricola]MCF3107302.1 hypothetical protein [Niabella agricola]
MNLRTELYSKASQAAGLPFEAVSGKTRQGDAPLARQIAHFHAKESLGLGCSEAARLFGVDHTTILHGVKRINGLFKSNDPRAIDMYRKFTGYSLDDVHRAHKVVYHTSGWFKVFDLYKKEIAVLSKQMLSREAFAATCEAAAKFFVTNGDELEVQMDKRDFIKLFTLVR